MSTLERNAYTKQMNISTMVMILLFGVVLFFAFGVPALKSTYGTQLFTMSESSY